MTKKSKAIAAEIKGIVLKQGNSATPVAYVIGEIPVNNEDERINPCSVTDIKFARKAWGQGSHVDEPCYGVYFEDPALLVVVAARNVHHVYLGTQENKSTLEEDHNAIKDSLILGAFAGEEVSR